MVFDRFLVPLKDMTSVNEGGRSPSSRGRQSEGSVIELPEMEAKVGLLQRWCR